MKRIHLRIGRQGRIETYTANYENSGDVWNGNLPSAERRPDLLALLKAVYGTGEDDFVDVTIEGETADQRYEMTDVDKEGKFTFKLQNEFCFHR